MDLPEAGRKTTVSLEERMFHFFQTGEYSDVEFIVGSGKNAKCFKAHRAILSIKSSVFASNFRRDHHTISLCLRDPDINPNTFEKVLRYLYRDDLIVYEGKAAALELLYAAKKYRIEDLIEKCIDYLKFLKREAEILSGDSEKATIFGIRSAGVSSVTITSIEAIDLLKSQEFLLSKEETVRMILKIDKTSVTSEGEFFSALLSWGRIECHRRHLEENPQNIRTVVEPLLPCILFSDMTVEQFKNVLSEAKDVFTDKEIVPIYAKLENMESNQDLPTWCNISDFRRIISSDVLDLPSKYYHEILHPDVMRAKRKAAIIRIRCLKKAVIRGIRLRWLGLVDERPRLDRPIARCTLRVMNLNTKIRVHMETILTTGEDNKLIFKRQISGASGEVLNVVVHVQVDRFQYVDFITEKHVRTSAFEMSAYSNLHSSEFEIIQIVFA